MAKEQLTENSRPLALVTGGNSGIGAACVRALAAAGMDVAINYYSEDAAACADAFASEVAKVNGVVARTYRADVSDFAAAGDMVAQIKADFGRVDVLVNNAGITRDGLLMRMKPEQFAAVVDTNLGGAFNCLRHVAPVMVRARRGAVISISSVSGLDGNAGQANYSASKAGIVGLTKAAAKELGGKNIRVNAVAPGFIDTQMTANFGEGEREAFCERITLKRMGRPEDIASAVAFLASDAASYITGQVLRVDGGLTI